MIRWTIGKERRQFFSVLLSNVNALRCLKDTYNLSNCIKNAKPRKINDIECKGMSPFNNTNHTAYISLTNNKNPMKIDAEDRRFVGIECNNKIANNNEYLCKLNEQLTSGKYDNYFITF
jgi:hypothetical protein